MSRESRAAIANDGKGHPLHGLSGFQDLISQDSIQSKESILGEY